jgi:Raf kinase inhibitor-like YbhB/YbcL family protein
MRTIPIVTLCALLLATSAVAQDRGKQAQRGAPPARPGMILTTTAFADGAEIPPKFTQSDPNPISPKLAWTNVPAGVVTFVLIMHDPEAAPQRKVEDQLHWLLFNIPGTTQELPEGYGTPDAKLADGSIQLKNGGGVVGYRGPGAPAAGPFHHYTLELYALDAKLDLGPDNTRADVLKAMDGHVLAKAVLMGRFHR